MKLKLIPAFGFVLSSEFDVCSVQLFEHAAGYTLEWLTSQE